MIYKRTGSLHKLQRAIAHSSLNLSLTYLRGLEAAKLKEEDILTTYFCIMDNNISLKSF